MGIEASGFTFEYVLERRFVCLDEIPVCHLRDEHCRDTVKRCTFVAFNAV